MYSVGDVIIEFKKSDRMSDTKERDFTDTVQHVLFVIGHKKTADGVQTFVTDQYGYEWPIEEKELKNTEQYVSAEDALLRMLAGFEEARR